MEWLESQGGKGRQSLILEQQPRQNVTPTSLKNPCPTVSLLTPRNEVSALFFLPNLTKDALLQRVRHNVSVFYHSYGPRQQGTSNRGGSQPRWSQVSPRRLFCVLQRVLVERMGVPELCGAVGGWREGNVLWPRAQAALKGSWTSPCPILGLGRACEGQQVAPSWVCELA